MIVGVPVVLWLVCAWVLRSRPNAAIGWALALSGIPMLGLVTWQAGPLWGFIALAVAVVLLRTPLRSVRTRARRAVE